MCFCVRRVKHLFEMLWCECVSLTRVDLHAMVWLAAPIDPAAPHRLLSYWCTPLRDARVLISQAFDPYFAALEDPQLPTQMISLHALNAQWLAH